MSVILAIAGASCSGKTMLAAAVAARSPGAVILPVDAYYCDLSHLPLDQRAAWNFDEPAAIEHDLLIQHVRHLRRGGSIHCPIYDFTTHTRRPETQPIGPSDFIIVEGLFPLYWPELRAEFDASVFLKAPDSECLARRIERDTRERGRTPQSVRAQYENTVRPMYEKYCEPTAQYATLILNGCANPETLIQATLNLIS